MADSSPQSSQDPKARAKKNFEALALRERQPRPSSPRPARESFKHLYDEKSADKSETVRLVEQVDALLKFLGTCLSSEGLHRKAAPEAILKKWRDASGKGNFIPDFSGINDEEHAASTRLKQLFAESYRGDRLIPTSLRVEVTKLDEKTDMDQHAKLFMKALPAPNRALFIKILDHLVDVNKNSRKNLMTVDALATVYGPKLIDDAGLDDMSYACKQSTAASLMRALINLRASQVNTGR